MSQDFSLHTKFIKQFLIIETEGYINGDAGEQLLKEATRYINRGNVHIILNLQETKVVNSMGVALIIELIEKLQSVDGHLYLSHLSPTIEKTFTIMGLFKYATRADTVEEIVG